jgi:type III secretion system YscQ/HrcQ family protein
LAALLRQIVPIALRSVRDVRGARAVLVLPEEMARGLVDLALGRPGSDDGCLTSGEEGALLYAVDRAAGDWLAAGGARFQLRGVLADAAQAADYLGAAPTWQVAARLTAGSLSGPLWLWCVAPVADLQPSKAPVRSGSCDLPVSWRVQVGDSVIPSTELAGLARGDVVELDGLCHPLGSRSRSEVQLVSGGMTRFARWLDHRRLELVSTGERRSPMNDRLDGPADVTASLEDAIDPVAGEMEVRLQVEVGRVAIALEQALSLLAGAVLELDRDVGPEVQVRAGDRLVARGELVDCEGRLAVQITEVP